MQKNLDLKISRHHLRRSQLAWQRQCQSQKPKVKQGSAHKNKKEKKEKKGKNEKAKEEKESFADKIKRWTQDDDEDQPKDDGSDEGDSNRELCKARKWKRMTDAGAIPGHIAEVMRNAKTRAAKTKIINELFEKDSKGKLVMKANKPIFAAAKETFHKKYGSDETIGKTYDVFLYEGNKDALVHAVDNGSVMAWTQDGVKFAGYRQTKAGVEKAVSDVHKVESGAKEVDDETYKGLNKAFSSMAWTFGDDEGEEPGSSTAAPSTSQKMLEHCGLTEGMKKVLNEAKGAHERLHAQAMKFLGKCQAQDDKNKFKSTVLDLKTWINQNDHVLTWSELPGGEALTPTAFKGYMTKQLTKQ